MQEKKISVIIPCYNSEAYLETCLDSLLNQTIGFENLEVIFINDASTDGTLELLYQYEHQHPQNIMVINYEQNRRQGYARNLGISYSSAPYFTCLDADDYVAPDMLEKMYDKMETGGYDYTICNYYRVIHGEPVIMEEEVQQEELYYTIRTEEDRRKFLLTDMPFKGSCGTIYRRSFIMEHQIAYPEGVLYEDLLWIGLLRFYATRVCVMPERFYYYVDWDNSSVVTKPNSTHHFDRLKVMLLFLQEVKRRGLYDTYKWETEMHFLQMYYINSISFFAMHFSRCPLSVVLQMRDVVLTQVPDYAKNPYLKNCYEFERTILRLIEINPRTQEAWDQIFEAIRKGVTE